MGRPSLEVKVTETVRLAPAVTESVPGTDGVATTESFEPLIPPLAPLNPTGPLEPVLLEVPVEVELEAVYVPLLVPDSEESQPERYASERSVMSNAR